MLSHERRQRLVPWLLAWHERSIEATDGTQRNPGLSYGWCSNLLVKAEDISQVVSWYAILRIAGNPQAKQGHELEVGSSWSRVPNPTVQVLYLWNGWITCDQLGGGVALGWFCSDVLRVIKGWRSVVMDASSSSALEMERLECLSGDSVDSNVAHGTQSECEESNANKKCDFGSMDAEIWSKMPDELLEKIIARLPLRFLFQSRALSKSWASKLSCASFQNEVSQVSMRSWGSYCPVYVGNEGLLGYDNRSKRCEKMLTLTYLPYPRVGECKLITNIRGKISGSGPLLCFVDCDHNPNIYVTNVITGKYKMLPPRPNKTYPAIVHLLLVGKDAYKVILITPLEAPCSQIYYSATQKWSIRYSEVVPVSSNLSLTAASSRWVSLNQAWISSNNAWTNSAYFNGTLYVLWGYQYDGPCELLAYNTDEETWMNIQINVLRPQLGQFDFFISMSRILVCAECVMVVIRLNISSNDVEEVRGVGWRTGKENLVVFKLDSDTREIREVSRGPPLPILGTELNEAASDGENIYFYQKLAPNSSVVAYNVRQQTWSSIPSVFNVESFHDALKKRHQPQQQFFFQPTTFSFRPGQNPFIEV